MCEKVSCHIKQLKVFGDFTKGRVYGIDREYFPKWAGWKLLELQATSEEVEEAAIQFYYEFFYKPMHLDKLSDKFIVNLLLGFATLHGKRKATAKLQQVLGLEQTGVPTASMMEKTNLISKYVLPNLLLEIEEFYFYLGDPSGGRWAIDVYRKMKKESSRL